MLNIENWWRGRLKWFWRMWGVNGWRSRRLALVTWDIGHGSGWRQRGDSSLPTCDLPFSSLRRKPIVSQPKGSSSRNLLLSKRSDVIIVGQKKERKKERKKKYIYIYISFPSQGVEQKFYFKPKESRCDHCGFPFILVLC